MGGVPISCPPIDTPRHARAYCAHIVKLTEAITMTISRETLDAILDARCPQYENGERQRSLTTAIRATGYAHGFDSADGDPWDYTAADMILAVSQHYGRTLARDYAEQHAYGAHAGTEARAARKVAAETADRRPAGMVRVSGSPGGDGIYRITY